MPTPSDDQTRRKEFLASMCLALQEVFPSEFAAFMAEKSRKGGTNGVERHEERRMETAVEASGVENGKENGEMVQGAEGDAKREYERNVRDWVEGRQGGKGRYKDASSFASASSAAAAAASASSSSSSAAAAVSSKSATQPVESSHGSEKESEKTETEMEGWK